TLCCKISYEVPINHVNIPKKSEADVLASDQLVNDFEAMLDSKTSDVVLVLGSEQKELRAHKAVMGARSPVFAAMFQHEMEEKLKSRVELPDVDFEVMQVLLKYMYTNKIDFLDRL